MGIIQLIDKAIEAAIQAGIKISEVYTTSDFNVKLKDDHSPLTRADLQAHTVILEFLGQTGLPVLSEEGNHPNFQERKNWPQYWLVDPLDGTREFIKRNGEFTVNIALMQNNEPLAGVIYVPVTGELFIGILGEGAWKLVNPHVDCTFQLMKQSGERLPMQNKKQNYVVAVSRSHINSETEAFLNEIRSLHGDFELVRRGSSLKICMVAEGVADVCPRFGPTMEWDTAAGHALVKAVGKNIWQTDLQSELQYNKPNLKNPNFIVI